MSDRTLSDAVEKLIDVIGQEAALFESFLDLLEQQQQALVTNDVDCLGRITDALREKTVHNQILNRQREEIIDDIRRVNAIEGDLSVGRLLALVEHQQADQLRHLRQVIFELHDKITDTRNHNATLINRSREYVAKTMSLLAKVGKPGSAYAATGASDTPDHTVAVDWRA
ncbi:MAG: flagellar protein FlgN [bacterium]